MTKEEAKIALLEGKKVTHAHFILGEFIKLKDGNIIDEDGCVMYNFWEFRKADYWDTGWAIFEQYSDEELKKIVIDAFGISIDYNGQHPKVMEAYLLCKDSNRLNIYEEAYNEFYGE